ncbi:hypothetical protein FOXYSP1_16846 [Fusarium oxysporum f. sp. phaseoli]
MSTRINGELRRPFPPSGTFLLVASPTVVSSTSSWTSKQVGRIVSRGRPVSGNISISSLEFSSTDRSSSFPYPKV